MELQKRTPHLTDPQLFGLALPPAGEPEALPEHLSECLICSRALQGWKSAVRELAQEDADAIAKRPAEEWAAAEENTLEALRRARRSARELPVRWAVMIAASLLLIALVLPARKSDRRSATRVVQTAELSPQDQADDALLRDVARLSHAEDAGGWNALVPDTGGAPARIEEDRL